MEETLRQEIEYKSQNEEDQGGIRRRLRDRELLKRKRAEAEEKETYQWVLGVESQGKRQKADQGRGAKRRGRPKKTDCAPESSFSQEVKVADPEAPAVEVLPQSVEAIPALGLDSLPTLGSGTLEPVSTWLPNPVLTPGPNVALVSPPSLVPPPITVPPAPSEALSAAPDVFRPPSAAFPAAAQDLATVSDQISAPDVAPPLTAVLPDLSSAPDQALARGSDLIQAPDPVPDLQTAPTTAQSSSPDSDLFTPPATDPPVSDQDLSTAPDLVPVSVPDVVLVSALSQVPVSEVVGAPASAIQWVETLSTDSQDKENIDLVPIEDLGPDELKNDVPPTQDKKADEDVSEKPSNNEPE